MSTYARSKITCIYEGLDLQMIGMVTLLRNKLGVIVIKTIHILLMTGNAEMPENAVSHLVGNLHLN